MESINRSNNVIITGGTQGLGFSIAKELISNGCENILILGRDQKKGSNASKQLKAGPSRSGHVRKLKTCGHLEKNTRKFENTSQKSYLLGTAVTWGTGLW